MCYFVLINSINKDNMMHKLLPILALPFLLIACDKAPQNQEDQNADLSFDAPRTEIYQCEDESEIEVTYAGDTAVVSANNNQYLMVQAVSASGVRYVSDEGIEWHVKGGEGAFGINNDTQVCTVVVDTPK